MLHFDIFMILEAILKSKTLIPIFKKCKFQYDFISAYCQNSASNIAWQAYTSKFQYIVYWYSPSKGVSHPK